MYIFGMILTHEGTFSNNRGENEGNTNTLQKVIRNGDLFSTVSAEAIRYALRDGWQQQGETLNRKTNDHRSVEYGDREFKNWSENLDDDVLGFMHAKEETKSRRAPLEITRAISVTPWAGETMNNFASPGSNPALTSKDPIPYSVEVHHTRYQFGFALTTDALGREKNQEASEHTPDERTRRVKAILDGLIQLRRVGGAHARYFADYSPEVIVLRVTDDPAPRFLYCFEQTEGSGVIRIERLNRMIESGDILAEELIIGATINISGLSENIPLAKGIKDAVEKCMEKLQPPQSNTNG